MKILPALLAVPLLFSACANYSACQDLRQNHATIAEIETALAELESAPPSSQRDQRMADLEKRRRMHLAGNDRAQALCRPIGQNRLQSNRVPGSDPHAPGR